MNHVVDASDSIDFAVIFGQTWSRAELDAFHSAYPRYGRVNLAAIARAIGTKSTPEVATFISFMDRAVRLTLEPCSC